MAAERSSSEGHDVLVAKLTVRDREKLLEYAQPLEPLMARHGGGLLGASSPALRALEGDRRPDVLVLQPWRSRDDFALLPIATALAGPFRTALGVRRPSPPRAPSSLRLAVIGLGRLDRDDLSSARRPRWPPPPRDRRWTELSTDEQHRRHLLLVNG